MNYCIMFTKYQLLLSGEFREQTQVIQCCPQKKHLKSLLPYLNRKKCPTVRIAVEFVGVEKRTKKATKFNTYPQRTYSNFLGRKVFRNGL